MWHTPYTTIISTHTNSDYSISNIDLNKSINSYSFFVADTHNATLHDTTKKLSIYPFVKAYQTLIKYLARTTRNLQLWPLQHNKIWENKFG